MYSVGGVWVYAIPERFPQTTVQSWLCDSHNALTYTLHYTTVTPSQNHTLEFCRQKKKLGAPIRCAHTTSKCARNIKMPHDRSDATKLATNKKKMYALHGIQQKGRPDVSNDTSQTLWVENKYQSSAWNYMKPYFSALLYQWTVMPSVTAGIFFIVCDTILWNNTFRSKY